MRTTHPSNAPVRVATIGFEYELHRIYGRHLERLGFSVTHHNDLASLKRSEASKDVRVLVVALNAIRGSHYEASRLVQAWPHALVITAGHLIEPDAAHRFLGAGVAGHLEWAIEQPRALAHMVGQLCGIL